MKQNVSVNKFLFRCEECNLILSAEFEEEEDLKDVREDQIVLDCECGGKAHYLMD